MKIITTAILAGVILAVTFCTSTPNAKSNEAQIKEEIARLLASYVNTVNSNGLEKAAAYFSEDERFYWVEDGMVQYPDRKALLEGIASLAPVVSSVRMQVLDTKIDVIDAQHALLFVQYKEDIHLKSDYTVKLDGAMTIMVEQKDNTWKFLSGHSSVKKTRPQS